MDHKIPWLNLHPGCCETAQIPKDVENNGHNMIGKHFLLELYQCNSIKLNDEAFVRTTLTYASKVSCARLLNLITHKFEPQGITGLALLAESHISIHTWPESRYAAVDVFTCGDQTLPEKACEFLSNEFLAQSHLIKSFIRQIPNDLNNKLRQPDIK